MSKADGAALLSNRLLYVEITEDGSVPSNFLPTDQVINLLEDPVV